MTLPLWFKERSYLHFDPPLSSIHFKDIYKIVSDPKAVEAHSFYPFISFKVTKYKIKEDPATQIRILDTSGERELVYCAHLDAHILSYYSSLLQTKYEEELVKNGIENSVLAFRKIKTSLGKSKSNIHFANEAFDRLKSMANGTAYTLDLKSYFDSINHKTLKEKWASLLNEQRLPKDHFQIFKFVTSRAIVDRSYLIQEFKIPKQNAISLMKNRRICDPKEFRERVRDKKQINLVLTGIAQGSPISAILSNVYLLDFDIEVRKILDQNGCEYYRYCDDILILAPSGCSLNIMLTIESMLLKLSLKTNPAKTEIVTFTTSNGHTTLSKPMQYLGFMFDGESKYIRSGSISQFLRKSRLAISRHRRDCERKNKIRTNKGLLPRPMFKKSLLEQYSHIGKKNFVSYGFRAATIMGSIKISKQMKKLDTLLLNEINK